jgi:hypothetical protein
MVIYFIIKFREFGSNKSKFKNQKIKILVKFDTNKYQA